MKRIEILGDIPRRVGLACSGGVDSMAVADFLIKGGRQVILINFDHGTEYGGRAREMLKAYCEDKNLMRVFPKTFDPPPNGVSVEAYWHKLRYEFYRHIAQTMKLDAIITCHHLDDQVETWIMTAATGNPRLIAHSNNETKVIRPFLLTRKSVFESWCERKGVPYLEDPSNEDTKYTRNLVRHEVVPAMLKVNPGMHKVIARKVRAAYDKRSER